ncbi:MAG: hypothetical protein GYA62_14585 [Bacteroidales bacterium]|mgnify:FL=1|nr:hypothetical protein [Bacteroidales bacterium]
MWQEYYSNGFLKCTEPYDPNSLLNAITGQVTYYSEKVNGLKTASGAKIESLAQGRWTFWVYYDNEPDKLNYYYYLDYINGVPGSKIYPPVTNKKVIKINEKRGN